MQGLPGFYFDETKNVRAELSNVLDKSKSCNIIWNSRYMNFKYYCVIDVDPLVDATRLTG